MSKGLLPPKIRVLIEVNYKRKWGGSWTLFSRDVVVPPPAVMLLMDFNCVPFIVWEEGRDIMGN